jgi:hypothetical protein
LQWGRVYRYSYNSGTKTYSLDSGFPVTVTKGKSETLVLDKDSTGMLWVTYVQSNKVMVNHSTGSNAASWGTPYILPVTGATNTSSDDIASLIAYDGRIGVMWSNQSDKKMYFATHIDGAADNQWQSTSAYAPPGSGADDHINLKSLQTDGNGNVFAVTKTSFTNSNEPIIVLLACTISDSCASPSDWKASTVNTVSDGGTRPILLIDTSNNQLNVFITESETGGPIRRKVANINNNIMFPSGQGDLFIKNATYKYTNNPTSTKQNVNSTTGLVVLASAATPHYYLHNYISLSGAAATNTPTATSGGAPTNTPTRTPTNTPTNTPTRTPTNTPTATSTGAPTATPTNTPTATPTTTQGGTLSFAPDADAHVKSAYPGTNYGTVNNLRLTYPGINSYLKFTVTGVSGPVRSAKIRLFAYDGSDVAGSIYSVSDTTWSEGGLTWSNAPPFTGAPLSTVGAVADNNWVEFDVTAAIQGNGTYSFGLSTTSSNSVFYNSKEAATNLPVLVVES